MEFGTIPIPVAFMDRPPTGWEAEQFTYKPANEYLEHWVAIDIPQARRLARRVLRAFNDLAAVYPLP